MLNIIITSDPESPLTPVRERVHIHFETHTEWGSMRTYKAVSPVDARALAVQLCAHADIAEKASCAPPTSDEYRAKAEVAIYDLGATSQRSTATTGAVSILTISDPVDGTPWLTRRLNHVTGVTTYFIHASAPPEVTAAVASPTAPTTRIFRKHDV